MTTEANIEQAFPAARRRGPPVSGPGPVMASGCGSSCPCRCGWR